MNNLRNILPLLRRLKKETIKSLKKEKNQILLNREKAWRLKIRAL